MSQKDLVQVTAQTAEATLPIVINDTLKYVSLSG